MLRRDYGNLENAIIDMHDQFGSNLIMHCPPIQPAKVDVNVCNGMAADMGSYFSRIIPDRGYIKAPECFGHDAHTRISVLCACVCVCA